MTSHPPRPVPNRSASGQTSARPRDIRSVNPAEVNPSQVNAVPDNHGTAWSDGGPTAWPDWPDESQHNWPAESARDESQHGWLGEPEPDWPREGPREAPDEREQDRQPEGRPEAPDVPDDEHADGRGFHAGPDAAGDERWAMLSYLGVPFLGLPIPLAIRVTKGRRSGFVRDHAVQALNLSVTGLLYTFCVLLLGGILALDSLSVALVIAAPLAVALWVATLVYVVRAAAAASRGGYLQIPAWICATIWR
jgi:uncharacterized Tic20 family protein